MIYDPDGQDPVEDAYLGDLDGITGYDNRRVIAKNDSPAKVRWNSKAPQRNFSKCDFIVKVNDSTISNCTFVFCRFRDSFWENVKFSNCRFENCDFHGISLKSCHFLNSCSFKSNSASGSYFRIEDTAISASEFMSGLETNLKYVEEAKKTYQVWRLLETREKIAKAIFSATREESDLDYYFQAHEQLVRSSLARRVARFRFNAGTELPNPRLAAELKSIPSRFEQGMLLASGWLTEWGRGIVRACVFFAVTVGFFALLYALVRPHLLLNEAPYPWHSALAEALNITLVAGYTAHFQGDAPPSMQFLWILNLALGVFWYSLVIPVLTRRILR